MADLAVLADVTARSPRTLTTGEQARAEVLLGDASAEVRRYTRQTFSTVTNDAVILRPVGSFLILPQRPVTAVDEVRGIQEDGTPGDPLVGWSWDGLEKIDVTTIGTFGDPWWPWSTGPDSFRVVYDHGVATVPDDVIGVVVGMVLRVILAPSPIEGLNTERIGQYSYGFQQGGGGNPGATVRLTEADKETLKDYRTKAGSIQVRV